MFSVIIEERDVTCEPEQQTQDTAETGKTYHFSTALLLGHLHLYRCTVFDAALA
jgi:hypothetical protein